MADNSDVKKLVKELEKAIEDGVNVFKIYKEISKEYQEQQKILMNNKKRNNDSVNKNLYEVYLVNSDKEFLKKKEQIRKVKKVVLSSIKTLLSELKRKMDKDTFNKLLKKILSSSYELSNTKRITFKTLMHHLESGEVSDQVAKTVKKIDELMTIGNIVNRKKQMEIGIKQKEIEKLLKEYEKTMGSLKKIAATKFPNKEITNNDIESLLKTKYSKENSAEFRKIINKLASELRILNGKIQTKIKQLQILEKSS